MGEIRVRRLNMDTSWEIHWDNSKILIDPWLIGSEVDYFSWFNEQWHSTKSVEIEDIENPDFILISQSYSDHCHEETLKKLNDKIPLLASPKAYKRLSKNFSKKRMVKLPIMEKDGFYEYGNLKIATIDPGRWMDPVYYAHIICKGDEAIFYSSHGFELNSKQIEILQSYHIKILFTSFSEIQLPSFLGGKVNPGLENVESLIHQLNPQFVTNTHDEQKKHSGLVMKLAKTKYPNLKSLHFGELKIREITDYKFQIFGQ